MNKRLEFNQSQIFIKSREDDDDDLNLDMGDGYEAPDLNPDIVDYKTPDHTSPAQSCNPFNRGRSSGQQVLPKRQKRINSNSNNGDNVEEKTPEQTHGFSAQQLIDMSRDRDSDFKSSQMDEQILNLDGRESYYNLALGQGQRQSASRVYVNGMRNSFNFNGDNSFQNMMAKSQSQIISNQMNNSEIPNSTQDHANMKRLYKLYLNELKNRTKNSINKRNSQISVLNNNWDNQSEYRREMDRRGSADVSRIIKKGSNQPSKMELGASNTYCTSNNQQSNLFGNQISKIGINHQRSLQINRQTYSGHKKTQSGDQALFQNWQRKSEIMQANDINNQENNLSRKILRSICQETISESQIDERKSHVILTSHKLGLTPINSAGNSQNNSQIYASGRTSPAKGVAVNLQHHQSHLSDDIFMQSIERKKEQLQQFQQSKLRHQLIDNYDTHNSRNNDNQNQTHNVAVQKNHEENQYYSVKNKSKSQVNDHSKQKSVTNRNRSLSDHKKQPNEVEWWEFLEKRHNHIERWNISDFVNINSSKFDPVHYLSLNAIECLKMHYSVPVFLNDIPALIKYDSLHNRLKIFNLTELLAEEREQYLKKDKKNPNIIKNDDGKFVLQELDQIIDVNNIQAFVYGPFLSRFWMMRIGMSQLTLDNSKKVQNEYDQIQKKKYKESSKIYDDNFDFDNKKSQVQKLGEEEEEDDSSTHSSCIESDEQNMEIPFYAWQCITLCLKSGNDLNLIIKNEQNMQILIMFLIMKLKSFDGARNTLQKVVKMNQENRRYTKGQIMQRIYKRYILMRVQMKISYEACRQCKTIPELFLTSILKTYKQRRKQGLIMNPYPKLKKKQIQGIQYLCLKNITEASKLELEAQQRQRQELIRLGNEHKQVHQKGIKHDCEDYKVHKVTEIKGDIPKHKNELYNIIRAIQKTIYNEDQFNEKNENDNRFKLTNDFVVEKKDKKTGMVKYSTNNELVKQMEEKESKLKKTIIFKNKILRQEKQGLYNKLNLMIKLRLLEGPLFIYALRELINLKKQLFVLELEKGSEAAIPRELSQIGLPMTYQFYDSLLEFVRQHVGIESKQYFFKYSKPSSQWGRMRSKSLDKVIQEKEVKLSNAERLRRYLQQKFDSKSVVNDDYQYKLNLYQQSYATQNGPYAQIKRKELRLINQGLNIRDDCAHDHDHHFRHAMQGKKRPDNFKKYSLKDMSYGKLVDIYSFASIQEDVIKNPNVQLVCEFLSAKTVGRKRKKAFGKKILFQNQMSSLKQKGKRLMMIQKVNREINDKKKEFLSIAENDKINESKEQIFALNGLVTDEEKKEYVQRLENVCDNFNEHTLSSQEQNIQKMRTNLLKSLLTAKTFDARSKMINDKIEYDQRFFNKGYLGIQIIVSDIRKQIRINQEIMRLKKKVNHVCDEIEDNKDDEDELNTPWTSNNQSKNMHRSKTSSFDFGLVSKLGTQGTMNLKKRNQQNYSQIDENNQEAKEVNKITEQSNEEGGPKIVFNEGLKILMQNAQQRQQQNAKNQQKQNKRDGSTPRQNKEVHSAMERSKSLKQIKSHIASPIDSSHIGTPNNISQEAKLILQILKNSSNLNQKKEDQDLWTKLKNATKNLKETDPQYEELGHLAKKIKKHKECIKVINQRLQTTDVNQQNKNLTRSKVSQEELIVESYRQRKEEEQDN